MDLSLRRSVHAIVVFVLFTVSMSACGKKASYSDIKVDSNGSLAGQPTPAQRTMPSVAPGEQGNGVKTPDFYDTSTGQIKDIPMFPGAKRDNFQFGPVSGYQTVMIRAKTRAPFDTITKFYDEELKKHGWSITENNRSKENFSWTLSRGDSTTANVVVSNDTLNNQIYILINRYERIPGSGTPSGEASPGATPNEAR